ncbi:MAG: hypothetical protein Q9219_002284 [cf. Caloplaca sp. 3 TL-2023]
MQLHHILPFLSAIIPFAISAPLEALEVRTTCPSTNLVKDPGFESGVEPPTSGGNAWTVGAFYGSSSYSLTSPGSTRSGGKYAFTASVFPGPYSDLSGENLIQTLTTCAGKNYSISADFKFNSTENNACSIAIQYPFKTTLGSVTTGSGTPGITPGIWYQTGSIFQAVSTASKLSILFRCNGQGVRNLISVDNVKVMLYAGNAY